MSVLVGNTPLLDDAIGFEQVTRGALKLLIDNLNDEIADRQTRWAAADLEWQSWTGSSVGQTDVDEIPLDHFHEGAHQTIIQAPVSQFPMVSAMAYLIQPAAERFDQFDTATIRLFVEAMVHAGPVAEGSDVTFETIVHRKIERTTEAIAAVIRRDPTLCGTAKPGIERLPRGGIGAQAWVRREEKGKEPRHMWQGSRLEYTIQRHSL